MESHTWHIFDVDVAHLTSVTQGRSNPTDGHYRSPDAGFRMVPKAPIFGINHSDGAQRKQIGFVQENDLKHFYDFEGRWRVQFEWFRVRSNFAQTTY